MAVSVQANSRRDPQDTPYTGPSARGWATPPTWSATRNASVAASVPGSTRYTIAAEFGRYSATGTHRSRPSKSIPPGW